MVFYRPFLLLTMRSCCIKMFLIVKIGGIRTGYLLFILNQCTALYFAAGPGRAFGRLVGKIFPSNF